MLLRFLNLLSNEQQQQQQKQQQLAISDHKPPMRTFNKEYDSRNYMEMLDYGERVNYKFVSMVLDARAAPVYAKNLDDEGGIAYIRFDKSRFYFENLYYRQKELTIYYKL